MAQPHYSTGMETGNEGLSDTSKVHTTWTSAIYDKAEIGPNSNFPPFSEVHILKLKFVF